MTKPDSAGRSYINLAGTPEQIKAQADAIVAQTAGNTTQRAYALEVLEDAGDGPAVTVLRNAMREAATQDAKQLSWATGQAIKPFAYFAGFTLLGATGAAGGSILIGGAGLEGWGGLGATSLNFGVNGAVSNIGIRKMLGQEVSPRTFAVDATLGTVLNFTGGAIVGRYTGALGPIGARSTIEAPSIEVQFQANSLRLADEGHTIFTDGVDSGEIVLNPRLSMDIQRGSFVDEYIRTGNMALRDELGLDAGTVRINQRLYTPNGKYSVPDLHFPETGNIIDYSYQLKSATMPQIMRFQEAVPGGTITIVPPSAIRPVYPIGP